MVDNRREELAGRVLGMVPEGSKAGRSRTGEQGQEDERRGEDLSYSRRGMTPVEERRGVLSFGIVWS